MKLINIEDELLLKTVSVGGLSAKALWRLIKNQRTIEAIPIEWIEKYTKRNFPLANGEIVLGFMADMLEDWEKENEQNKENTSQTD